MTLLNAMLAMEISSPGAPDVLKPVSVPVPVPGHGQIIIRVAYAGVNRPDALQRLGLYTPPANASPLPGLEPAAHHHVGPDGKAGFRQAGRVAHRHA